MKKIIALVLLLTMMFTASLYADEKNKTAKTNQPLTITDMDDESKTVSIPEGAVVEVLFGDAYDLLIGYKGVKGFVCCYAVGDHPATVVESFTLKDDKTGKTINVPVKADVKIFSIRMNEETGDDEFLVRYKGVQGWVNMQNIEESYRRGFFDFFNKVCPECGKKTGKSIGNGHYRCSSCGTEWHYEDGGAVQDL